MLSATERAGPDSAETTLTALLHEDEQRMRHLLAAARDVLAERHATASRIRPLVRLMWRLSRAAFTDALTGLVNRRGFMRDGSRLLGLATRRRQFAVVFFVDVDRLKLVNDTDGHAAGDELLRATAHALQATFRSGDVIGRVGGDEFAVVTLVARADAAAVILRRLARVLTRINSMRATWPIEVSVGVSIYSPEQRECLGGLLDRADQLMYEDKRARRSLETHDGEPGVPERVPRRGIETRRHDAGWA